MSKKTSQFKPWRWIRSSQGSWRNCMNSVSLSEGSWDRSGNARSFRIPRQNSKATFKEMPSNGSCITYKILNSLIAPRDSTYLLARLKYFTQQTYSCIISETLQNTFTETQNRRPNNVQKTSAQSYKIQIKILLFPRGFLLNDSPAARRPKGPPARYGPEAQSWFSLVFCPGVNPCT